MIALPILIPLFAAILLVFSTNTRYQKVVGVSGAFAAFAVSVLIIRKVAGKQILVMQASNWDAPFGISLVIDTFSALMLLITGFVSFAIAIYSLFYIDEKLITHRYFLFFQTLLMGVNGAFITGDIFNLYVWFEVMLMSSFVLITLGSKVMQLKGGIKYLTMNLVASLFFLAGIGILYGKTGTLNMAHLAVIFQNDEQAFLINTSTMLFFLAFAIKAAVFPFFFWLPSSYHTPPVATTAFFAALLTKVGVYAMIRVFTLFFMQNPGFWHTLLLVVAGLTMVIGGMAAASHSEIRRILSFHIISQIGYMIFGLGIFSPLALAGAIYFMVHNMLAKTNTFLVAGHIHRLKGTFQLKGIGGLYKSYPLLGILFIIPAFALAGVPPLSGFFGKFFLIKAGFEAENWIISGVAIFTGVLTLFSMIKIWNEAFFKKGLENTPNGGQEGKLPLKELFPSMLLGMGTICLGIGAGVFYEYFIEAGEQLMNSGHYIDMVLKNFEHAPN